MNDSNSRANWLDIRRKEETMCQRNLLLTIALVVLSFGVLACAHVNYVGRSFEPTTDVDVYLSTEEIEREYVVIGHAIGTGQTFVSNDKIGSKLIEKARSIGADAILITGVGKDNVPAGDGSVTEKQIQASFLKYK
jgi:hypothetical protein